MIAQELAKKADRLYFYEVQKRSSARIARSANQLLSLVKDHDEVRVATQTSPEEWLIMNDFKTNHAPAFNFAHALLYVRELDTARSLASVGVDFSAYAVSNTGMEEIL